MNEATIEISAQFGGRDAAAKVLPHFRALKAAGQGVVVPSFPFDKLGFILRVDGEVTSYGLSGAGNVDIDKKGEYVSIDIGIRRDDWSSLSANELAEAIQQAIKTSTQLLKDVGGARLQRIDFEELEKSLSEFCRRYVARIGSAES